MTDEQQLEAEAASVFGPEDEAPELFAIRYRFQYTFNAEWSDWFWVTSRLFRELQDARAWARTFHDSIKNGQVYEVTVAALAEIPF